MFCFSRPFPRRVLGALALCCAASLAQAGEFTVSAAASLTNAFTDIARAYEAKYPKDKVQLNFAGSGVLLQQMLKGAPVDVFASADQETMDQAVEKGLIRAADRRNFARNTLVLVVPVDSALSISSLNDLTAPAVQRIAIANVQSVPVGRYSQHALQAAGLWDALQPKAVGTQNVRQSLDYVARGEVDAGFVYASDAALMPDKVRVAFTVAQTEPVLYPVGCIACAAGGAHAKEAKRFIDYVLSPAGQGVLEKYGFLKP